jgi:hypothetical protein
MDNLNRVEQKAEEQLLDLNVKDRNETFNSIQYKYIATNKENSRMQTCVDIVYKLLHIPCVQRHNYIAALASFPEVKREEADR